MRHPSRILFASLALGIAACGPKPHPGPLTGPDGAAPTVLEKTWGMEWRTDPDFQYGKGSGDPLEKEYQAADAPAVDTKYYEEHLRTETAAGTPVPLLDQFVFVDATSNQPVGSPPPDPAAEFVASDGKRVRLADYQGRTVVLVFTRGYPGYVCPMCTTYTAQISASYSKIKDAGGEVLLVFPGEESKVDEFIAACRAIQEEEGPGALPFPVLLDPKLTAVDRFHLRADLSRPATYVLDAVGDVRYAFVGKEPHERPSVERILSEVQAAQAGSRSG